MLYSIRKNWGQAWKAMFLGENKDIRVRVWEAYISSIHNIFLILHYPPQIQSRSLRSLTN